MQKPGLVSCIVPVFNGELYLKEALESIFAQSYATIEVIVVDDGSTDGTSKVAKEYGDRIQFYQQPNQGPPAARNLGLSKTSGEYVAFLDADDLWRPNKIELQLEYLQSHPEVSGCVTQIQNFWIPALEAERIKFQGTPVSMPMPGFVTQTLLATKAAFEKVGSFNQTSIAGDATDWFLRAKDAGVKCNLLEQVLVDRRLHQANSSRGWGDLSKTIILEYLHSSLKRKKLDQASALEASEKPKTS